MSETIIVTEAIFLYLGFLSWTLGQSIFQKYWRINPWNFQGLIQKSGFSLGDQEKWRGASKGSETICKISSGEVFCLEFPGVK